MAKILITGGTGLLGSNLVKRLQDEGHEIKNLSRRLGVDLLDKALVEDIINEFQPDYVYHLAANAAESRGQISPIDMTERNINIFLHTLVPSINNKVKRFIYISSVAVYGDVEVPYSENDIPKPKDIYGINKLACEQMLKVLAKVHNLDYTIFRPHNVYGPHQDMSNPYKNVVALFMRSIMEGTEVKIFGEGKMTRAFSYVDDVVDVLVDSLNEQYKNQTINLGSSYETSIGDLLTMIEGIAGKKVNKVMLPARPQEIFRFLPNNRKLKDLYFYNETPLEVGLRKTWEFINLPEIIHEDNEIKEVK